MRGLLEIQEGIALRLEQRDEEVWQLRSQSQSDGAQLAVLSLQLQELISSVESRAEVVGSSRDQWAVCVMNTNTHFKNNSSMPRYL